MAMDGTAEFSIEHFEDQSFPKEPSLTLGQDVTPDRPEIIEAAEVADLISMAMDGTAEFSTEHFEDQSFPKEPSLTLGQDVTPDRPEIIEAAEVADLISNITVEQLAVSSWIESAELLRDEKVGPADALRKRLRQFLATAVGSARKLVLDSLWTVQRGHDDAAPGEWIVRHCSETIQRGVRCWQAR